MRGFGNVIQRIDKKNVIHIPFTLILLMAFLIVPSAQTATAESPNGEGKHIGVSGPSNGELPKGIVPDLSARKTGSVTHKDDNVGFYIPSQMRWYLKNNTISGWNEITSFGFGGPAEMIPVTGDWDGDGEDTVGFYIPDQMRWYLKDNDTSGWNGITAFGFGGPAEMIPVAGDWDGDGFDTVGFYIPDQMRWYLKDNTTSGWNGITSFGFGGPAEMIPVTGDWDGDRKDTVGFYIPGQMRWYLKNDKSDGWNDIISFGFGGPAEMAPVAGDWDGDGVDRVGHYIPDQMRWCLKHSLTDGWDGITYFNFGGSAEMVPVTGNWDGPLGPYVEKVDDQVSIPAGETGYTSVNCPGQSVVLSGGYAANPGVFVYEHFKDGNGWKVYAKNTKSTSQTLSVNATCLRGVDGVSTTQTMKQVDVFSWDDDYAVASCPQGSVVTGGGWETYANGSLRVDSSSKGGNGWEVWVRNLSGSSRKFTAYAVCLSGAGASTTEVSSDVSIPSSETDSAGTACGTGELVAGGGFAAENGLVVYSTFVDPYANKWLTYAWNPESESRLLTGYAECLSFP